MRRRRAIWITAIVVVVGVGGWWLFRTLTTIRTTPVYDGPSTGLRQTVIVPTLDSPTPVDRNVIWCATFTLAWREAQNKFYHGQIKVAGAEEIANRLNNAPLSDLNLDPKDYYVNAGRTEDGIVDAIRSEMRERYPDVPAAWLPEPQPDGGIVAYGYLAAQLKFPIPFPQIDDEYPFITADKQRTPVRVFGITSYYEGKLFSLRKQVKVLFAHETERQNHLDTYAIDPCSTSDPYQLVLACVPRKETLAATVADVQQRIEEAGKDPEYDHTFNEMDCLSIPEMRWRITHHFTELETSADGDPKGKAFDVAMQTIDFTLDRSGVQLTSAAQDVRKAIPRHFNFTKPFLLYMTSRGAKDPFFVMWVDNAELLDK